VTSEKRPRGTGGAAGPGREAGTTDFFGAAGTLAYARLSAWISAGWMWILTTHVVRLILKSTTPHLEGGYQGLEEAGVVILLGKRLRHGYAPHVGGSSRQAFAESATICGVPS